MGIKHLNKFFIDNCTTRAIRKLDLQFLVNKVIVIDTSIYLYKFAERGAILENFYLMISVFRNYQITPVFIFDGKPPAEKRELLLRRRLEKMAAEERYHELKEGGDADPFELDALKRQFVRVTEKDIQDAKNMMRVYGVTYFEAGGESDQLCAYLVKHNYAWACLSDDMDMFLYGCPRVLRHMSLMRHDVVFYDTARILADLDMTQEAFRDIAILSGTDYNIRDETSLCEIIQCFTEYRRIAYHWDTEDAGFVDWICTNAHCLSDREKLEKVRSMFDLDEFARKNREEIKRVIDSIPFQLNPYQVEHLHELLHEDGFIFPVIAGGL